MKTTATLFCVLTLAACAAYATDEATVAVRRPDIRWLFGGMGFQHPEAALAPLMTDEFRDERVLKAFREIEPTFARAYTAFADSRREQLDSFADYYDMTFRKTGTTLYVVPSTMPGGADRIDIPSYAAACASNFAYLVRERNCSKLRYYCLSNEMTTYDEWGWFIHEQRRGLFAAFTSALAEAFRRERLSAEIIAPDYSGPPEQQAELLNWTAEKLNRDIGAYVIHWYVYGREPGDPGVWPMCRAAFSNDVAIAIAKHKRLILGEYGFSPTQPRPGVMVDDWSVNGRSPERAPKAALAQAEMALAAMVEGAYSCVAWSFVDYPDPFVVEDGDTPAEKARFYAAKSCYRPDVKYNKWGLFRWSDARRDYRAYPNFYTQSLLAKYFRKGATVLPLDVSAEGLHAGAVENPDGSVSVALVNWGKARRVTLSGEIPSRKPLRRYVYEAANPPENAFNDMPPPVGLVAVKDGALAVELPADSMTVLTSDYTTRKPAPVTGVALKDGRLVWKASSDADHRYYRVYHDGRQIASTVATQFVRLPAGADVAELAVRSVDRWGNVGE